MIQGSTLRAACIGVFIAAATPLAAHADGIAGQGTWTTTLQARDLDGDTGNGPEAYYDTELTITWLAHDSSWGDAPSPVMTWQEAVQWAAGLNVHGVTGWRLPAARPIGGQRYSLEFSNNGRTDFGTAGANAWGHASELGHLYYVTLGNKGACTADDDDPSNCHDEPEYGLSNTGPFASMSGYYFWTGSRWTGEDEGEGEGEGGDDGGEHYAWSFSTFDGYQSLFDEGDGSLLAWAVRDGDVPAIPEPSTGALLLLGLAPVICAARSRRLRTPRHVA